MIDRYSQGAADYKEVGPHAAWRTLRYTAKQFWDMMRDQGIPPCPIFDLPGVGLEVICIDVLHALDLGFTQDVLGNILWEYLASGLCVGRSLDARVKSLWAQWKEHQKTYKTPCKLQGLTKEMIKLDKKPPKLRAKGAETRILLFIMI